MQKQADDQTQRSMLMAGGSAAGGTAGYWTGTAAGRLAQDTAQDMLAASFLKSLQTPEGSAKGLEFDRLREISGKTQPTMHHARQVAAELFDQPEKFIGAVHARNPQDAVVARRVFRSMKHLPRYLGAAGVAAGALGGLGVTSLATRPDKSRLQKLKERLTE